MQYIDHYESPLGGILLAADDIGLTGLWFEGQKYFARNLDRHYKEQNLPVFEQTHSWLNDYFSGIKPHHAPSLHLIGTDFQISVWEILQSIGYGQTTTYGAIAREIAAREGKKHMAAQAVGGAVGHNNISLIIPCHRVVGANGELTGYAGGIEKKTALLTLEGVNVEELCSFAKKKPA